MSKSSIVCRFKYDAVGSGLKTIPPRFDNGLASCGFESHNQGMEKIARIFTDPKEMKADEYRYWQSRPVHERMSAVSEMTLAAYAIKERAPHVQRLQGTLVLLPRPQR